MSNKHNPTSFKKGEAFEGYVEQVLFPKSDYDLLHKTNAYDQNNERYVGDSKKPDYRFKCRITGAEFHIEAKYRSKSFNDSYDILSKTQVKTFAAIHAENPIFIALGYGNEANDPAYVSLIPYEQHRDLRIPVEIALNYQIDKATVPSNLVLRRKLLLRNWRKKP